jgi:Abortive infection alpha
MFDPIETIKAAPELAKAIYSDTLSNTLKEVGKIGVDAAKTFHLALFPLQFSAALQDRLAAYINTAIRKVPEEQRLSPQQSLALSICESLKFCDESETVSALYVNLLARAMNRERVGEAHPAFVNIISQLAPDEILLIRQLGVESAQTQSELHKVYFRRVTERHRVLPKSEVAEIVSRSQADLNLNNLIISTCIEPEELAQPDLYATFLEHLVSIGIVGYTNYPITNSGSLKEYTRGKFEGVEMFCIELNYFGRLFFNACIKPD